MIYKSDAYCSVYNCIYILTGARIGIAMSYFSSKKAAGPTMAWESPKSFPAINGYTLYSDVTFANFAFTCNKRHRAIMSNPWIGDIIHPVEVKGIVKYTQHLPTANDFSWL